MPRFDARVFDGWSAAAPRFAALSGSPGCTPFQSPRWLDAFYRAFAARPGVTAIPVEVRRGGETAMLLPLIKVRGPRFATIEFADLGITDYNLPVLGPAAPVTDRDATAAWDAVRRALPPADLAVFTKMPTTIGAARNPLVAALPAEPSRLFGNYVAPGDDYEGWLRTLDKHDRKELGRFWRVFTREPDARFVRATTAAEAAPILAWIETAQSERIRAMGLPYLLDDPDYAGFYRAMMTDGVADGTVVVTALMAGDEVVAGLYGVADGRQYAMVRIALAGGKWANCSPGRLVIERSIEALHREGYRWFDFTIGDYAHKRGFSAAHTPLVDATVALSMRGLPAVGFERAKAFVKHRPELERLVRKVLSRAA